MNLMNMIPAPIVAELHRLVRNDLVALVEKAMSALLVAILGWNKSDFVPRTFSMHKFLPHESVANGSFNLGHNTVLPQFKVWEDELGNTEEALWLLITRLEKDFVSLNPSMRKPYQSKEVATGIGEVYVFIF